jgi:hypothetical protein
MKKKKAASPPTNGNKTKTNIDKKLRYSKSSAVKSLEVLANAAAAAKYPMIRPELLAKRTFRDDSANSLTKCITTFLNLKGHIANRIANAGRLLDQRKTFRDITGVTRTIGQIEWIPGTGTNGIADIVACISGKMVGIEVKYGSDRQSQAQREYQEQLEAAGGLYVIVRDFAGFLQWYNQTFCNE